MKRGGLKEEKACSERGNTKTRIQKQTNINNKQRNNNKEKIKGQKLTAQYVAKPELVKFCFQESWYILKVTFNL